MYSSDSDPNPTQRSQKPVLAMHEWESQEKLLSDIEHQEVTNPLVYQEFLYSKHEWDNIPVIVPRYLIYISKYVQGLASFCHQASQQESTQSLRSDLDRKYQEVHGVIKAKREEDLREKERFTHQLEAVKTHLGTVQTHLDGAQSKVQEDLKQSMYQLFKTPQVKLLEHKDYTREERDPEVHQNRARHFSLNQLKDLFYIHLNRSKLCHQFHEVKEASAQHTESIEALQAKDDWLKTYLDAQISELTKRMDKFEDQAALQQQYNESKQADLGNRISMHSDSISRLQDFQRDSTKFQDSVRLMHEKTQQKIQTERERMEFHLEQTSAELKYKISEIDKFVTQQFDAISDTMEKFKEATGDLLDQKEKGIVERSNARMGEMQLYIEEAIAEIHRQRQEVQEKYEKKFTKVKEVITNYFEKYDVDLEEVKISMKVLNQKYADWSKILIEPTSLNEARLYTLETRLHEEEEIRIKEYEFVRDLMRKLIFSLEQTSNASLDLQQRLSQTRSVDRSENQDGKTPQLPTLLQTQSIGQKPTTQQAEKGPINLNELGVGLQAKTNDVLMLKRLNFLKSTLDTHSPRQTTQQARIKALKRKDERVVELWKKEMEAPSIKEILQQYVNNKPEVKIDFNERPKPINKSVQKPRPLQLSSIGGMSRNTDALKDESVIVSRRGQLDTLQPMSTTNYETSISNVKTSNDSAFLTQKVHAFNKTAKLGQSFLGSGVQALNQSVGSIDQKVVSKISKNKFLTNSDQKKIREDLRRGDFQLKEVTVKDQLKDSFWADFDQQIQTKHQAYQQALVDKKANQRDL